MTLDNILEEIKKAETIVVLCHESPDGDAVASSLSVMHAVAKLGKEADVIIPKYLIFYQEQIKYYKKEEQINMIWQYLWIAQI